MFKQRIDIYNWSIRKQGKIFSLIGEVDNRKVIYKNSRMDNIETSELLRIDFKKGLAETRNTVYTLHE
jgi:hypothetical protein